MSRPLLLDLFCGAGGAAMGYHRAGFDVIGVDIKPQPHYPFEFFQRDALDILYILRNRMSVGWLGGSGSVWSSAKPAWAGPSAIHASPPCQRYIRGGTIDKPKHPDLLPTVREQLVSTGLPWVIENVPGAPMRPDIQLCGSQFGLEVRRHRWFEFSHAPTVLVSPCDHSQPVAGVYGNPHGKRGAWPGMLPSDAETWSRAMGIDWMTASELADAIPPAYTAFVGQQLIEQLERAA